MLGFVSAERIYMRNCESKDLSYQEASHLCNGIYSMPTILHFAKIMFKSGVKNVVSHRYTTIWNKMPCRLLRNDKLL